MNTLDAQAVKNSVRVQECKSIIQCIQENYCHLSHDVILIQLGAGVVRAVPYPYSNNV